LELLHSLGIPSVGLRSKSWEEFAAIGAPRMDVILTVCDSAAGEVCPVWPGRPISAHWGVADPAAATGNDDDKRKAFAAALAALKERIDRLLSLPSGKVDRDALTRITSR
jgi:protein-tyrosine-phosphatase